METGKVRRLIEEWLDCPHCTVFWVARMEMKEGVEQGTISDLYLVKGKRKAERFLVFFDFINECVRYAYDFQDWKLPEWGEATTEWGENYD